MATILTWLFNMFGADALKALLSWIEGQWPGSAAIINQIVTWLNAGVPASTISAHLTKMDTASFAGGLPQGKP
jgi:hypothetical protein